MLQSANGSVTIVGTSRYESTSQNSDSSRTICSSRTRYSSRTSYDIGGQTVDGEDRSDLPVRHSTTHIRPSNAHPRRGSLQPGVFNASRREPFQGGRGLLPEGWVGRIDPNSGDHYYAYASTGHSRWTSPVPLRSDSSTDSAGLLLETVTEADEPGQWATNEGRETQPPDSISDTSGIIPQERQDGESLKTALSNPARAPKSDQPPKVTVAVLGATSLETQSFMTALDGGSSPSDSTSQYGQSFTSRRKSLSNRYSVIQDCLRFIRCHGSIMAV